MLQSGELDIEAEEEAGLEGKTSAGRGGKETRSVLRRCGERLFQEDR